MAEIEASMKDEIEAEAEETEAILAKRLEKEVRARLRPSGHEGSATRAEEAALPHTAEKADDKCGTASSAETTLRTIS